MLIARTALNCVRDCGGCARARRLYSVRFFFVYMSLYICDAVVAVEKRFSFNLVKKKKGSTLLLNMKKRRRKNLMQSSNRNVNH